MYLQDQNQHNVHCTSIIITQPLRFRKSTISIIFGFLRLNFYHSVHTSLQAHLQPSTSHILSIEHVTVTNISNNHYGRGNHWEWSLYSCQAAADRGLINL